MPISTTLQTDGQISANRHNERFQPIRRQTMKLQWIVLPALTPRMSGKIRGVTAEYERTHDDEARFTDTTENLARFVTDAGDSLWGHGPFSFDRTEMVQKP
jgi:hypothetical protein